MYSFKYPSVLNVILCSYIEWHSVLYFFFLGLRLWKIGYGNSCRKQTRQLRRMRSRVRSMMPWPVPWARHGQLWSPCLKEEGSSSGWPLNFLKVPWRFVFLKPSPFSTSEQMNSIPRNALFPQTDIAVGSPKMAE